MATAAGLAKKPDAKLKEFVERAQLQAFTTQSVAYVYVTAAEHPEIPEGDAIEVVCVPDPAGRFAPGDELPTPGEDVHGLIVERDGVLYRCRNPRPGSGTELEWMKIAPEWKDDAVAAKTHVKLTAYTGVVQQPGLVSLRAGMEAARERLSELG